MQAGSIRLVGPIGDVPVRPDEDLGDTVRAPLWRPSRTVRRRSYVRLVPSALPVPAPGSVALGQQQPAAAWPDAATLPQQAESPTRPGVTTSAGASARTV